VLAGEYPAPSLAAGAVGPDALAPIPAARIDGVRTSCTTSGGYGVPANADAVPLRWNNDQYDVGDVHEPCASELRAPRTGIYTVSAAIEWPIAAEDGARTLAIRRGSRDVVVADARTVLRGQAVQQSISTTLRLTGGSSVQALVYTKGTALVLDTVLETTHATLTFVSP
jgi:hypothetical protein